MTRRNHPWVSRAMKRKAKRAAMPINVWRRELERQEAGWSAHVYELFDGWLWQVPSDSA